MKLKSVAGIVCYAKDLDKTAKFYEALGFQFDRREKDHVSLRLNWFWEELVYCHIIPHSSAAG